MDPQKRPRDGLDTVDAYRQAGQQLLKEGAPLVAYDMLAEGLKRFPHDVRLRQLLALSLARTGASRLANEILERLVGEGAADEETLGLLGRTYKDLWADSADEEDRRRNLEAAFQYYQRAYEEFRGYWSGINAATVALLLGRTARARELANAVRGQCLALWQDDASRGDPYWLLATLGEAALLRRDLREAEAWYTRAAEAGRGHLGNVASTRRNARLILRHLDLDARSIEPCFRIPRVVVFAGHLIDRPDRAVPRFPQALAPAVADALRAWVRRGDVGFGFASAACGSDILFLESLAEVGAEAHIVLPYNRQQFQADSVDIVPGTDWAARYGRLLDEAAEVVVASEQRMRGTAMSYEYGFLVLDGTAGVRADALETELVCLAVWDGKPGDGPGGTAGSVARWQRAGRHVEIIDLAAIVAAHGAFAIQGPPSARTVPAVQSADADSRAGVRFDAEIVGLLFADARGFSRLTEEQIPRFIEHFLGTIAAELARAPSPPILTNTWGDGLYFVFRSVKDTGDFALRLCDAVRRVDWTEHGLPPTLNLRVGLHAGPAYACLDPVTRRPNYLGAHVSLAARIEPITPPGEVYASGAFAALARAEEVEEFICAYVGQTPLAKGFGTFPTYVVHRRRERRA